MDPLSQGLLGAGVALSCSKRKTLVIAACCGITGGMAPDLDILIRSDSDPLLALEYHRHFTHSLFFAPFGGLLVALGLWLFFFRRQTTFLTIYYFTTLGFATHGLLDACTSYGTRLYWPISDFRATWTIISIIDPIFTLTLLVFCILSLVRHSVILARVGLVLSMLYLGFGLIKREQVDSFIYDIAEKRRHTIDRIFLNPTIGNNILWRSVYQSGDYYYIDAVYNSGFSPPILHEGTRVATIDKEAIFPALGKDSVQREDIRRFSYFSKDFIYLHPDRNHVIGDLRYGILPYDNQALWGIKIDPNNPDHHVIFSNFRKFKDRHLDEFWLMLDGKSPAKEKE